MTHTSDSPSSLPPGFARLSGPGLAQLRARLPASVDVAVAIQTVTLSGQTYKRYWIVVADSEFHWTGIGMSLDGLARRCRAAWMQTAAA